MSLLAVDGLSVSYDVPGGAMTAVSDVSLTIREGEAVGLVGESGSGKSTIAASILDLLGPGAHIRAGSIRLEGADLAALGPKRRRSLLGNRIGTVFQDPFTSLNPSLRIGKQIAEPLMHHRGLGREAAHARAVALLHELGIAEPREVARAYPHQLSGGMRQRALVAAAIACEPSLLILDEPTTALDVTIEAQLLDLLRALRRRHGMGILFISHNLAVVRRLCDRIVVLYAGRVVEEGPAAAVFGSPTHPYTKGLLASLPRFGTTLHRLAPIPGRFPDLRALPQGCVFRPRCPFEVEACKMAEPPLLEGEPGRRVRCIRHHETRDAPWPVWDHAPGLPKVRHSSAFVATHAISKTFTLGHKWRLLPPAGGLVRRETLTVPAVRRTTLEIESGEVLGLVGESGSGKSTLGRLLLRLLRPTDGRIVLDGRDITDADEDTLRPLRGMAQIIFQNPDSSLNPRRRVQDALARPIRLFDEAGQQDVSKRVAELLDAVQLPAAYAARYPHQLSGGEKQRVGIARALATRPRFIVCDESVSALDVSVQAAIVNLLADLRAQLGLTLLFISHDLSVVAHLADRIAVMYRGAICEIGPAQSILHPPYHPYTQALLSAVPTVAAQGGHRIELKSSALNSADAACVFADRCPMKIGPVCEREPPTVHSFPGGHRIRCHHEPSVLEQMTDVVGRNPAVALVKKDIPE